MAKLFISPDPRLSAILVKGEMMIDESNRNTIMTRSKARAGMSFSYTVTDMMGYS